LRSVGSASSRSPVCLRSGQPPRAVLDLREPLVDPGQVELGEARA
jgi:hypothetical protein